MKTLRIDGNGTRAIAICRATPLPQSTTYAESLATMTCADAARVGRGLGPPAVPSRINRVPARDGGRGGPSAIVLRPGPSAAAAARNVRRSIPASLPARRLAFGDGASRDDAVPAVYADAAAIAVAALI